MVDSIFDRPMFGTPGTSEEVDKAIDKAGIAPPKNETVNQFPQYSYDQIYDDSFVPFDEAGIKTLLSTYVEPDAIREAYAEYKGQPKTAADFAAEYDAFTPDVADADSNFKFENYLALARLGLGLMQPTPGGAIAPAISKAGENFLGDLAAINERKRQQKAQLRQEEKEDEVAKRQYILTALKEQQDLRNAQEYDLFMKVLQFNMDSDQGNIAFRRALAQQNFAYKYDVDLKAIENNARLIRERFEQDPKVFALKPEGTDQSVRYVSGFIGVDPEDGIKKPFIPKEVDGKIIYEPAPLDAVAATFNMTGDGALKEDIKLQIQQAEKINTGNQALAFIEDIKLSIAENRARVGLPGAVKKVLQNVKGTILDVADVLVANDLIDQDAYESAKSKIETSVFNDLASQYGAANPQRSGVDFYSDLESDEAKIYQEFFVKPRQNYDPALAANEIKLNSIYYALARARKPTGRLNVDDIKNAKQSLQLYNLDTSSDTVITALQSIEYELRGFVEAQRKIYDANNFNEEFLFNYKPERFHITVDLEATAPGDVDALDPYANLPEGVE
tara:strand:+ start:73 stop:1752 length:1680 start_codon:yes stop_codon:yes gene_type:complete